MKKCTILSLMIVILVYTFILSACNIETGIVTSQEVAMGIDETLPVTEATATEIELSLKSSEETIKEENEIINDDYWGEWCRDGTHELHTAPNAECLANIINYIGYFDMSWEPVKKYINTYNVEHWFDFDLNVVPVEEIYVASVTDDGVIFDYGLRIDDSPPGDEVEDKETECDRHVWWFHDTKRFGSDGIVSFEDWIAWCELLGAPLTSPDDECLINIVTFVEFFEIPREVMERYTGVRTFSYFTGNDLDAIYNGDWDLINEYFHPENTALLAPQGEERENQHYTEILVELQQKVYDNTDRHSKYYHDIWTYAHFKSGGFKSKYARWMQPLVESGNYKKVNIVEFFTNIGLWAEPLENWIQHDNLDIYTHYNVDVIFSGDQALIDSYYAKENELTHTKLVQEAFDAYAALHGAPDTSWMLK